MATHTHTHSFGHLCYGTFKGLSITDKILSVGYVCVCMCVALEVRLISDPLNLTVADATDKHIFPSFPYKLISQTVS